MSLHVRQFDLFSLWLCCRVHTTVQARLCYTIVFKTMKCKSWPNSYQNVWVQKKLYFFQSRKCVGHPCYWTFGSSVVYVYSGIVNHISVLQLAQFIVSNKLFNPTVWTSFSWHLINFNLIWHSWFSFMARHKDQPNTISLFCCKCYKSAKTYGMPVDLHVRL